MKANIFFLLCAVFISQRSLASKVVSTGHGDWDELAPWSSGEIPSHPDTIVISHYITLSHDLLISAPTVVIVDENGTICGDYQLDVACGAKLMNYGHVYLNTVKIRSGWNFNEFYAKNLVEVLGCGTSGSDGFVNVAPKGQTKVWPATLCKTTDTNWPSKETTNIPVNAAEEFFLSISPNPLNSGYLSIATKGDFEMKLFDTKGALVYSGSGKEKAFIDLHDYTSGFYFISVIYKDKIVNRKVLIAQ